MAKEAFHVAIIGGGLCGVSLAIALTKRNISYTIYESRASFSEIGAGINLAPNSLQAFNLIDPSLRDSIFALATRNQPGDEDVWMNVRLGTPTAHFPDGKLLAKIKAPPTGNTAVGRNELLQLLAGRTAESTHRFNKKVVDYSQDEEGVTLMFSDGTQERASVAIACDGVHSAVRRKMFSGPHDDGKPPAAARPQFTGHCCFRAVFPLAKHIECVGAGNALSSHVYVGPSGYMINYPINGGRDVNINIWSREVRTDWEDDQTWVIPRQKARALEEFRGWGPIVQKILDGLSEDTSMWAVHYHGASTPKSYFDGRIVLIGDAAHSMGPHQGQGAAQSMEDACVMAEVLSLIDDPKSGKDASLSRRVEAAFRAYESVRRERFERVMVTSQEAFAWWAGLWKQDLAQEDLDNFQREAYDRFRWIWGVDVAAEGEKAKHEMRSLLAAES